ncbi:GntR family transcriptional regulator [Paracoccus benzoatiresistens]|uniref:GntR family transcriptional regulator n=1 Tax=Paracoccus benzoatiresistens TaxID=2997341 RepID=A0ABT4J0W6_9RHOB|nr:GntR family transcriptional regulator [Paracoccus sp. EF6]MCZ0960737.1 GntR family transcriptional regulator [Paracoccus sp. EF6]
MKSHADKPLKPVSTRKTVQDQVYEQLREALMSGAFQARESFTIASLSERFQTSHMPVREALRRLAAENALRIAPSGTAFVPDLSPEELDDISRARVIIEGAAAELAAPRITPSDRAVLASLVEEHRATGASGDIVAMAAANRRFHFQIYAAAGSPILMSHIENLWLRSGPYVRFLSDRMGSLLQTDYKGQFTRHHEAMLAALDRGDVAGFRAAMEDDITATQGLLHRFLADRAA